MEDYYFAAQEGGKRRRSRSKSKGSPKGFFGFLAEFRNSKEAKGLSVTQVAKAAGRHWRKMSDAEKAKYGKPTGRKGRRSRKSKSRSRSHSKRRRSSRKSKGKKRSKSKSRRRKSKSRRRKSKSKGKKRRKSKSKSKSKGKKRSRKRSKSRSRKKKQRGRGDSAELKQILMSRIFGQ